MKGFGRVAVLDRGPTAVRVLAAVADLARGDDAGPAPATLVVHDDRVPDSDPARAADEVLVLGPEAYLADPDGRRRSRFLDHEQLVGALGRAFVDLVWLGCGVVGDPAEFTRLAEAAGIAVIGPSAAVRTVLADRAAVLTAAADLGLPVVPWSGRPVTGPQDAAEVADRLGYPVALVASGPSGRRGVHLVRSRTGLLAAFAAAHADALRESGNPDLFVVADPDAGRQVEVDVITDEAGTAWPLATRECVLGRHRQVVLAECPAAVPAQVDVQLREAAAVLASRLGLSGASSVRFRVGADGWGVLGVDVLPRLSQALTEEVTGLDLAVLALGPARDELPEGGPPPVTGHAVQVRLRAVDPDRGFVPTPGRIETLDVPAASGVRVERGQRAGDLLPPDHDPLLAAVTVWGRDRAEALARLRRALDRTVAVVAGGATNRAFLRALLDRPAVVDGTADSHWLEEHLAAGAHRPPADPLALVCAAVEAYETDRAAALAAFHAGAARGRPALPDQVGTRMVLGYRGTSYRLRVDQTAPGDYRVSGLDGGAPLPEPHGSRTAPDPGVAEVAVERSGRFERRVRCGGRRRTAVTATHGAVIRVELNGTAHEIRRRDGIVVRAGWPALVVAVTVAPGSWVRAGDQVAVLESMKLEAAVTAPVSGQVLSVEVTPNAQVETGAALLRIRAGQPPGPAAPAGTPAVQAVPRRPRARRS